MKTTLRRLQPRWLAEISGLAALCVGAFHLSSIAGWVATGIALVLEGSYGEPLAPRPERDE
jgi:hypothetical protein